MTTDTLGGVWTYSLSLARALQAHQIETSLATMGAPLTVDQRAQVREIESVTVFESEYKLEWMVDPWNDVVRAGEWLLALERSTHPDIIHLNGYAHGSLAWSEPTVMAGHSCVLSWWKAVKGEEAPPEWDHYREKVTKGLGAADVVIAPTAAMLSELVHYYGPLPAGRVIPNGIEASEFRPGLKEEFVLAAGRLWDPAKNIAALERVASELPWPVYAAGWESESENGSRKTAVKPLGYLPRTQLINWFERASIYALPARYEPFGLSALEAGIAGCALVLGDIPTLAEVWQDAAILVPADDEQALKEALTQLMHDQSRLRKYALLARERAREFSIEKTAAGYLDVYREVLREPAGHKQQSH